MVIYHFLLIGGSSQGEHDFSVQISIFIVYSLRTLHTYVCVYIYTHPEKKFAYEIIPKTRQKTQISAVSPATFLNGTFTLRPKTSLKKHFPVSLSSSIVSLLFEDIRISVHAQF